MRAAAALSANDAPRSTWDVCRVMCDGCVVYCVLWCEASGGRMTQMRDVCCVCVCVCFVSCGEIVTDSWITGILIIPWNVPLRIVRGTSGSGMSEM